jgi:hypothetical protein
LSKITVSIVGTVIIIIIIQIFIMRTKSGEKPGIIGAAEYQFGRMRLGKMLLRYVIYLLTLHSRLFDGRIGEVRGLELKHI